MTLRKLIKFWLYNSCPGFAGRFPYYGTHVYFPRNAPIFRLLCQSGMYEYDIVSRVTKLIRPNSTFFDVGANIGLMSVPALATCPSCRVVSFEPSPNTLPFLERTINASAYSDRWTITGKGISSCAGELDFSTGHPDFALFEGFKSGNRMPNSKSVKVPVSTLDCEWHTLEQPSVSLVKIDVEGGEAGVLDGAVEMIRACHPAIITEWHEAYLNPFGTSPNYLLQFAKNFGYRIFTIPFGVPVDDETTLRVQMMDCSNFLLVH